MRGSKPPYNPAGGPPPQPQQQYYPPPQQQQPYYQQQPPQGYPPYQHQQPMSPSHSGAPVFINNNVAPAAAPSGPTVIYAGGPNQGGCAAGNHQMVERTKAMGYVWCILCFWNPICWVCLCRKKHVCRQCGYSPDSGPCGA